MFIFQATFLKFVIYKGNGSWQQLQNFSSISSKLCQLDQKTTGDMGVNTTLVIINSFLPLFVLSTSIRYDTVTYIMNDIKDFFIAVVTFTSQRF